MTHTKKEKKKTWPTWEEKKNLSYSGKKKNKQTKTCPRIHSWDLSYSGGRVEATSKRRVSFWSVTMTFPSKVQPAGRLEMAMRREMENVFQFMLSGVESHSMIVNIGNVIAVDIHYHQAVKFVDPYRPTR